MCAKTLDSSQGRPPKIRVDIPPHMCIQSYVCFFLWLFGPFGTPQLGQFWPKQQNSTANAPCGIQGNPNGPSCVLKHLIHHRAVHKNSCGHPPPHMCTLCSTKSQNIHLIIFFLPNARMRKLFVWSFFFLHSLVIPPIHIFRQNKNMFGPARATETS